MIEIASHLSGDGFASAPTDDGRGTDPANNLFTYTTNVQAWLDNEHTLSQNNYNSWPANMMQLLRRRPTPTSDFALTSTRPVAVPTNTYLHLAEDIVFTPPIPTSPRT